MVSLLIPFPLLVITGMHDSLLQINLTNRAVNGYENSVVPINDVTNVTQSGATFAVALRSKNSNMKQIALSSGISAAIEASDGNVYSPVSGVIMLISETKHAIGFLGDNGGEVLVHIGMDTVELGGKGFDFDLTQGQRV